MKKLLITLLCCLVLAGCGKDETEKTAQSSIEESKTSEAGDTEEPKETEPEYINGFEKADYEKFNSYASENGLDGTSIYVKGTVKEITDKNDTIAVIIEQGDANKWIIAVGQKPLLGESELKRLLNKEIEVFGEYIGYSDAFNMPSIDISSDDEDYCILTDESERLTQRSFYSNMKELRKWYKNNSEEIFLSDRKSKKNRSTFKTSTGVVANIHITDEGYSIEFIQKLNGKYSVQHATVDEMILCETNVLKGVKKGDGLKSYYYVDEDGQPNLFAMEKVKSSFKLSDYKNDYKSKCKEYTYEKIARNPNKVKGKYAKFTGKVIQVMEEDNSIGLRVDITKSEYGFYSDTIYVTYTRKNKNEDKILEDDIITIYGKLAGTETYTSVLGAEVTLPKINAEYIELNKK